MAKSFAEWSHWFKAALVFVVLAFVLHAAGVSLPHFLESDISEWETSSTGLWQTCSKSWDGFYQCQDSIFMHSDWLLPVQILECVGLGTILVTIFISLSLLLAITEERVAKANKIVCFAALCLIGPATITTIKMLLITPVTENFVEMNLGLSFYMCIVATFSLLVAYILFMVDDRKSNT